MDSTIPEATRLMTIPQVAETLCVSRSKVYELIADLALPSIHIDHSRRVAATDLEAFIAARREAP